MPEVNTEEIRDYWQDPNSRSAGADIEALCDEIDRLRDHLAAERALRKAWETTAQHLLDRAEKAEAHVRTLREAAVNILDDLDHASGNDDWSTSELRSVLDATKEDTNAS